MSYNTRFKEGDILEMDRETDHCPSWHGAIAIMGKNGKVSWLVPPSHPKPYTPADMYFTKIGHIE